MNDKPDAKESVRKLFIKRMEREGRRKEWYDTLNLVRKETGKRYSQASYDAMCRMGYEGPKREREIHAQYLADFEKSKLRLQIDKEREEIKAERHAENFESAVRSLPDKAPVTVEIDWIRAHPAMVKRARSKDKLKDVVIEVDDILCPPHGPAPSKAAVFALQHWVNQPGEFFKTLLSEQKKGKTSDGIGGVGAQEDLGLAEVERLLDQVSGKKHALETQGPAIRE